MFARSTSILHNYVQRSFSFRSSILSRNGIQFVLASTTAKSEDGDLASVDLAYASYENISLQEKKSPIVILHGFLGSKSNWNSLSKSLHKSTQRKVIALDARNHGDSPHTQEHTYRLMAADVVNSLKKLGIQKANLLGHSMGGRTAMLVALTHPELVSSLIVVDISPVSTSSRIYSMTNMLELMETVRIQPGVSLAEARRLADRQLSAIPDQHIRNFILTNLVGTNSKAYNWRLNLSVLKSTFGKEIAIFPTSSATYTGPTRFICGEMSDYVPESDFDEIKKLFPKADLHYIPDAGHWVHAEKPAEFLELAVSFLNSDS